MASQPLATLGTVSPFLGTKVTSNEIDNSPTARSPRSAQPRVFARLQALFPSSQPSPIPATSLPDATIHASTHSPQLIKTRIITWNMHDSLPKGNLEELLGSVPLYTPRSAIDVSDRMALPGLSLEEAHPYHLIVVGGQECPTLSGIPMGLAANFKHRDAKDREKEKHREHDSEKDRDRSKERPLLQHTKSLLKHIKHEHDTAIDVPQVHSPTPTSGWSAVLEDWFANGVGSLRGVKPVVIATGPNFSGDPNGNTHKRNSSSDAQNGCTGKVSKLSTQSLDLPSPNTVNVNWKSESSSAVNPGSFSASDAKTNSGPYELLVKARLMGIYTAVYVHKDVRSLVKGVSTGTVPAGLIGGRLGNKGGVGVSLNYNGTTLLFVNAHLAAHEGKVSLRVANLAKIKAELPVDSFLSPDDPRTFAEDITDKFDHTWIFGDLNFRLDISRLHADWLVSRKEYKQALAFDQLTKLIEDGDPIFKGLREATINFPPTFKYDVTYSMKAGKNVSRHRHKYSKVDLEEKDLIVEQANREEEDDDDELGEATSLRSSAWASNNSRHRTDATENEDDSNDSPTSSFAPRLANEIPTSPTSKLVSHAAKAKVAWLALLDVSSNIRATKLAPKRKRGTSAAKLNVPGSAIELSRGIKGTSDASAVFLNPPPMRRATSTRASVSRWKQEDDPSLDSDKGVYDSSSKQRVPSWCDRILWKTTVEPPEEPEPELELESGDDPTRSRGRTNRMGQLFLQAFRPRARRPSMQADFLIDAPKPSEQRALNVPSQFTKPLTSHALSQSRSLDPLPRPLINHVNTPAPLSKSGRQRSASAMALADRPAPRRFSMPVASRPTGLLPHPRRADSDQPPSSPLQGDTGSSSPAITAANALAAPKRWFLNLIYHVPSSPTISSSTDLQSQPTMAPRHRKGDVVCLSYRTLDDQQMRHLEGRSDHRPVIGSTTLFEFCKSWSDLILTGSARYVSTLIMLPSSLNVQELAPRTVACLERLIRHQPQQVIDSTSSYPRSISAAVLVLLYEKAGSLRVLLTTRSKSLRSHPFQTALPGGKHDSEDADMTVTAFREAYEEVGLPLDCPHLHVLCHLRPFLSLYRLLVTPVVAFLTDLSVLETLTPSPDEVDNIFDHPLEAILDPDLAMNEPLSMQGSENWPYATDYYNTSDTQSPTSLVGTYRMHRFRSCYTPIKGLTADILITVAEIAYDRKASYERFAPNQIDSMTAISLLLQRHEENLATRSSK